MILHGPYAINAGQPTKITDLGAGPDVAAIVIMNESPFMTSSNAPGVAGSLPVTAFFADNFLVPGFTGQLIVSPISFLSATSIGSAPASVIFIITYAYNEPLTQALLKGLPTGYPMPLPRLSNVGNAVNTVGGASSNLQNDGNAIASFIEATIAGQSTSSWAFNTDGTGFLALLISSALVKVIQTSTADPVLKLGAATHLVEILGNIQLDGTINNLNISPPSPPVLTGSTSGTITFYNLLKGTIKWDVLQYNNFRNGGASTINQAFPVPYTFGAFLITTDTAGFNLLSGGSAQQISQMTSLSTTGGTQSSQAQFNFFSIGGIAHAFDTYQATATNSTAHNGFAIIIGI